MNSRNKIHTHNAIPNFYLDNGRGVFFLYKTAPKHKQLTSIATSKIKYIKVYVSPNLESSVILIFEYMKRYRSQTNKIRKLIFSDLKWQSAIDKLSSLLCKYKNNTNILF